ncbi:MAG: endonuclease domain-containing protein [Nanoarchaeota archaeon]
MPKGIFTAKRGKGRPFERGHKGYKVWLGKKIPPDVIERRSLKRIGMRVSPNTEFKKGQNLGAKNPLWKGGISKDYKSYKKAWKIKDRERKAGRKKPENCEICGAMGGICFDHDHKTGTFRGWICRRCNLTLGFVKDSQELLFLMINYLKGRN